MVSRTGGVSLQSKLMSHGQLFPIDRWQVFMVVLEIADRTIGSLAVWTDSWLHSSNRTETHQMVRPKTLTVPVVFGASASRICWMLLAGRLEWIISSAYIYKNCFYHNIIMVETESPGVPSFYLLIYGEGSRRKWKDVKVLLSGV
jgi:hypothetical protein